MTAERLDIFPLTVMDPNLIEGSSFTLCIISVRLNPWMSDSLGWIGSFPCIIIENKKSTHLIVSAVFKIKLSRSPVSVVFS
jgi:hypothetical protein